MNALIPFRFESHAVRVIEIDGAPWFVAKDVALALGYACWQPNIISHVPEKWRGINPINTPYGEQKINCLSEQGLYFFIGRSDKPKALPFQEWLAGEVLPAIRKTGGYQVGAQPTPLVAAELNHLRAQLDACHAFILKRNPLFGNLQRYQRAGLTQREIAILCGWAKRETVRIHVRQAQALGLLPSRASQLSLLEG